MDFGIGIFNFLRDGFAVIGIIMTILLCAEAVSDFKQRKDRQRKDSWKP